MNPEIAIQAYYKLLNSGFRPSFAAGTDYPCNDSRPLGALLTYAQPAGGQMTYANWINAIKNGRTVVSRNGHNEFLSLTVNGTATPGDEIDLSAAGSVQVSIQWTAAQSLSGNNRTRKQRCRYRKPGGLRWPEFTRNVDRYCEFRKERLACCAAHGCRRAPGAYRRRVYDRQWCSDTCERRRSPVLRQLDELSADQHFSRRRLELLFPNQSERSTSTLSGCKDALPADCQRSSGYWANPFFH